MATRLGNAGNNSLTGTVSADAIYGFDGNDTLHGLGDNDWLDAGDGDDTVYGDAGDDNIFGGAGADKLYGGLGNDNIVDFDPGDTNFDRQFVDGGAGNDRIDVKADEGFGEALGGSGDDVIRFVADGSSGVSGGSGNDYIDLASGGNFAIAYGDEGNDTMVVFGLVGLYASGGAGNDTISAEVADTFAFATLVGGSGNDVLNGSSGDDHLIGGSGRDTMRGLAGNDVYDFNSGSSGTGANADLIVGFDGVGNAVGDRIDLSDLSSGVLAFRGTAAFTGVNQVRVLDNGTYTEIDINLSGGLAPEAVIQVDDQGALASQWRAGDFIL